MPDIAVMVYRSRPAKCATQPPLREESPPPEVVRSADARRAREQPTRNVPDILVHVKDRPLLIEIAVTHAVDAAKLARIRRLGISALEITLRDFEREPTLPALRQELLFGTGSKRWLYNARAEAVRQQVFALSEAKALRSDGLTVYVEDCPLSARQIGGKPAANVVADCLPCPYCVRAGADGHLLCTGGRRIGAYADLIGLMDRPPFS